MKAWQLTEFGDTLDLVEVATPRPRPDQVLIQVHAVGLCTSDLHIMDGSISMDGLSPTQSQPPAIIGHEIAGVIVEIGADVTDFTVGDRVSADSMPGVGVDIHVGGGYGEYITRAPHQLIRIPDAVGFVQAAVGTDAGSTAHKAVIGVAGVKAGTRVGIIGLGALGLNGARLAALAGAEVYAADVSDASFEAAKAAGVKGTYRSAEEFAPLDLDVIIDFAGMNTTKTAIEVVKPGGRVVQVGLGMPEITFPASTLVFRQVHLVGSLAGSVEDTAALYRLMEAGSFSMDVETIRFEDINEGLSRMRRGEVQGRRLVAEYPIQ